MTRARDFADVISGNFNIPSGSLGNATPADGSITAAKLASGAVTTVKLAADAVTNAKIAADAITSTELADDAVVTAAIADDAITSALIADDAVVAAAIADDAVSSAAIADDAITSALIADDAVVAAAIADNAVTSAAIAANAVGDSEFSGSTGKCLQVVSARNRNTASGGGSAWTQFNISVTITPSSTSSKILLICDFPNNYTGTTNDMHIRLRRGTTDVYGTSGNSTLAGVNKFSNVTNMGSSRRGFNFNFYDSPSTTSAITYTVQMYNTSGNTLYLNYPSGGRGEQVMTAMEIGG